MAAAAVVAAAPPDDGLTYRVGAGIYSCGSWLSTPARVQEGEVWIMGYWSGLNRANPQGRTVGRSTDADGLIGEVRKVCEEQPSMKLIDAATQAYVKLQAVGR